MKFLGIEIDACKLSIRNYLGTFKSTFSNLATANRTVTIPDRNFTIAGTDQLIDATTTNSGFINTVNQSFSGEKTFNGGITNVKVAEGVIRGNLGNPSVEEMALCPAQYNNKLRWTPPTTIEYSSDGITWVSDTASVVAFKDIMIGVGNLGLSAVLLDSTADKLYYRILWDCSTLPYIWLNSVYLYGSSSGRQIRFNVVTQSPTTLLYNTIASGVVSNWPGHIYLPHSNLAVYPAYYAKFGLVIEAVNPLDAYFALSSIEWFGGFPSGRRDAESYDADKNATFPAILSGERLGLSSATLLATAKSNIIESDGNALYFDNTSLVRKKLAFFTDIPVVTYPTSTTTSINLSTVLGTSLALTVTAGLAFVSGDNYLIYSASNQANHIECSFVSYAATTLTVLVEFVSGTATFTNGIITKSTGVFGTYLTSDFSNNTTTAQNVVPFLLFGEAGVMYNIKISGCYSSNATNNGAYINTLSGVAASYLTGKAWMSNDNSGTSTATESVMSFNTSTSRFISKTTTAANATPYAVGMDFNVILPTSANIYVRFACTTGGITSNLLAGTSIIITRLKA